MREEGRPRFVAAMRGSLSADVDARFYHPSPAAAQRNDALLEDERRAR
jgi:hypothetical protein